jgi:hypothetical protein
LDLPFTRPYEGAAGKIAGATPPRGIHGLHPISTPKYVLGQNTERLDYTETMARLYVPVSPAERARFMQSVQESHYDPTTGVLAEALTGRGYLEFLLQRASHPHLEKAEIVETVADTFVAYFFGAAASTFSYSGVVLNTVEDDQAVNLFRLYRDILRGSELAKRRKRVNIAYDSYIVSGTILNLQEDYTAENETAVPFSFSLLVHAIYLRINYGQFGLVVPELEFEHFVKMGDDSLASGPVSSMRIVEIPHARSLPPTDSSGAAAAAPMALNDELEKAPVMVKGVLPSSDDVVGYQNILTKQWYLDENGTEPWSGG